MAPISLTLYFFHFYLILRAKVRFLFETGKKIGRKFRKNIVGYIKFLQRRGKITTRYKKLVYFVTPVRKARLQVFLLLFAPLGTIGESIAAIRRFHSLRSFHQRLLKVGPLRGPEVICET